MLSAAEILPWLPAVFTLIGWFVVNQQNNNREKRKEARAAADKCKSLTGEVSQLAFNYWLKKDDTQEWQIKALLEELEVEISRLTDPDKKQGDLLDRHIDLVEAITGADFESVSRTDKPRNHRIFRDIATARQRLLYEIESRFAWRFDGEKWIN